MFIFLCFYFVVAASSQYINYGEYYGNFTGPCTDKNHLFLTPGVLAAGGSNRVCLSRFYSEGSARLLVTLVLENQQTVVNSRELSPGDGGCIDITVPQLPNTKAELVVNIRYPEAQCYWERRTTLRIASGKVLTVHTERARYRPGEMLRARVFALKADLTPTHGVIDEIWVEGPRGAWEGTRAVQWLRTRTKLGVAQVQHEIDELAPTGRWTVRAKLADGSQGSASFWVGNYDLPPFQLSVRHSPKILRTSDRLVWTVCVRYPWSEAVEGMLVIRLRGAGDTSPGDGNPGIRTAVRLRAPRACHRHAAASRRIGLDGANPPDVVVADFSFQEEGTRMWQNTTAISQVVDKPISLEFLTKHRVVIAPGLPYKLKVRATRWDEKPSANEHIQVCRSAANDTDPEDVKNTTSEVCGIAVTDADGIARVMFTAGEDHTLYYKFQASLRNDSSTRAPALLVGVQRGRGARAALGARTRSLVPLYLALTDVTSALTVHFVVITRTGIIYRWGATTQCPITSSSAQIQTSTRNGPCNAHVASLDSSRRDASSLFDANASDALLDRHLLRVILPVKVTQQMCPDSQLIAYFYHKGELISASKRFELDECLVNKVEGTWVSRQILPGSTASLRLETTGPALCALTVLDVTAKVPGQNIKDTLMTRLRSLMESYRNLTEYDAAGDCFLNSESPDALPSNNLELTAAWLASAGVRTLGSNIPQRRYCPKETPSSLVADDGTVQRSDFSEAWLWKLVGVGVNGSVVVNARAPDSITKYEATAVCIAKNGIGISQPAVLQVFREFFIHADGPKRLRRGDVGILQYRIFNYLYQPLSVQVQMASNDHISQTESVWTACVGARSSRARRIELRARSAGTARLALTASSVVDAACPNATTALVSDVVILQIKIEPEGVPVHDHQSILLCDRGNPETTASQISWSWPAVTAVPDTETLTVWAAGDVTGPLYADADDLVLLPRGCGEQNMARLALNFLALNQLAPDTPATVTAKEHVARGFTRQLQYIHPVGGFSAFGASDVTPSTWLTAFSIRYLRRIHQVLSPGFPAPPALERAERWLLGQQMENGCFRNEGQVFHRELKGGLNEDGEIANVALTAYVISSLAESSITLPSKVLRNTLSCLRAVPPLTSKNPSRVYPHAILAYTLMRLKTYEEDIRRTNDVSLRDNNLEDLKEDEGYRELVDLLKLAKRSGDYVWWETGSLSTSIEATGYAVLALARCAAPLRAHCAGDARGAVRWLAAHRAPHGGFLSTQDTLVAIEALVTWSSVQPSIPTNLTITAMSNSSIKSIRLAPADKIPEIMKLTLGDKLKVSVQGTGCALIQATRSYNTLSPVNDEDKILSVQVSVYTDGPFDCDANSTWCFCGARIETCVVWMGSFPEMALLEVSLPGGFGADASRLYSQLHQDNTLLRRIEMSSSGSRVTMYLATRDGSGTAASGHQCFTLHAVGPRAKTKPAYARLMDYYRPDVNDTQMFTIPEDCPLKISEITNDYTAKYNLYNKAKSLNSGEILITDEIPFEDLPDVIIPIEDSIYENLTRNNRIKNVTATNATNTTNVAEAFNDETKNISERNVGEYATELIHTVNDKHNIKISTEPRKADLIDKSGLGNPQLSVFHVVDKEIDLDVPTGMEGPIPAYVLPPQNFLAMLPPNSSPTIAVLPPVNVPNMNTELYGRSYWYYPHESYRHTYPPRTSPPTPKIHYRL